MSTWEKRMSAKAKARIAAQEAEDEAHWDAVNPALPGEGAVYSEGPHAGHRTHTDWFHGNAVVCQCGAIMGVFSIALSEDDPPQPDSCPVCTARGTTVRPFTPDPADGWRTL